MHLNAVFEWVVDETDLHSCTCKSWGAISLNKLTKIVFTVFHNRASHILRGSKQWRTLTSKISRRSGPRTLAGSTPMVGPTSGQILLSSRGCQTSSLSSPLIYPLLNPHPEGEPGLNQHKLQNQSCLGPSMNLLIAWSLTGCGMALL